MTKLCQRDSGREERFCITVKKPFGMPTFHNGILGYQSQLHFQFQLSSNVHPLRQQIIRKVLGSLSPTQKIQIKLQDPDFSLDQLWSLQTFRERQRIETVFFFQTILKQVTFLKWAGNQKLTERAPNSKSWNDLTKKIKQYQIMIKISMSLYYYKLLNKQGRRDKFVQLSK